MPTIRLNGKPRDIGESISVADLLVELERHPRLVAVEHNGEILKRERFAETVLADGDRVEVVQFVQGG